MNPWKLLAGLFLAVSLVGAQAEDTEASKSQNKVVYHIDDAQGQVAALADGGEGTTERAAGADPRGDDTALGY